MPPLHYPNPNPSICADAERGCEEAAKLDGKACNQPSCIREKRYETHKAIAHVL